MKCDFCGHMFEKNESMAGCNGCPMSKSCQKVKCPNCNYEMYPQPENKAFNTIKSMIKKVIRKSAEE